MPDPAAAGASYTVNTAANIVSPKFDTRNTTNADPYLTKSIESAPNVHISRLNSNIFGTRNLCTAAYLPASMRLEVTTNLAPATFSTPRLATKPAAAARAPTRKQRAHLSAT